MTDANEPEQDRPARGKRYSTPTLTEYGSVAKLTMVKANTVVENPTQKKSCL